MTLQTLYEKERPTELRNSSIYVTGTSYFLFTRNYSNSVLSTFKGDVVRFQVSFSLTLDGTSLSCRRSTVSTGLKGSQYRLEVLGDTDVEAGSKGKKSSCRLHSCVLVSGDGPVS